MASESATRKGLHSSDSATGKRLHGKPICDWKAFTWQAILRLVYCEKHYNENGNSPNPYEQNIAVRGDKVGLYEPHSFNHCPAPTNIAISEADLHRYEDKPRCVEKALTYSARKKRSAKLILCRPTWSRVVLLRIPLKTLVSFAGRRSQK